MTPILLAAAAAAAIALNAEPRSPGAFPARALAQAPAQTPTQAQRQSAPPAADLPQSEWPAFEAQFLDQPRQLTFRSDFVRAGEAYFDPSSTWMVFQGVPVPTPGAPVDPFFAMYVARFTPGHASVEHLTRVSPPKTANTCGWFHPTSPGTLLYSSTITVPTDPTPSGFQIGTRRYIWQFPVEMEIVEQEVFPVVAGTGPDAAPTRGLPRADSEPRAAFKRPLYDAEASYDPTGRFILYTHVITRLTPEEIAAGIEPDADISIFDTKTGRHHPIVVAPGYDGGPFFSPDGRSITYRSDRAGDNLLQLFVADLRFETGPDGVEIPVGMEREFQLTANEHVQWAPFWHPSGNFLVYASSELGHRNYEVYAIKVDRDAMNAAAKAAGDQARTVVVPGLPVQRITAAPGADVLPVFSPDGRWFMWTSQRGPRIAGEERPSSQIWIARWLGGDNPFPKAAP